MQNINFGKLYIPQTPENNENINAITPSRETKKSAITFFNKLEKKSADKDSDLDFIIDTRETLMGFKLYSLITKIEEAFKKPVDAFEKTEIIKNSKIDKEIQRTGVVVYEK